MVAMILEPEKRRGLRTWIEIDRAAVAHNYQSFRHLIDPAQQLGGKASKLLMGVVKSNAYGHGLWDMARTLVELGVDWLGVDSIVEAVRLRENKIAKPILVLGYTLPEHFAAAAAAGITLSISGFESLEALRLANFPQPLRIHIKVDTGMSRQGFLPNVWSKLLSSLERLPASVVVDGVFSHLAAAGLARFTHSTHRQIEIFEKFLAEFDTRKIHQSERFIRHLAATSATVAYTEAHYDLVRVGLGLYGYWPSGSSRNGPPASGRISRPKLEPPLAWKTIVSEIKSFEKPARVGYNFTGKVAAGARLAICPIGYWHGYPRALSNCGRVRINRQFTRVVGRVSMDMIAIDVNKMKNLQVGDEVVLLDGVRGPSAEELAELTKTSPYEIITRLNPLIERFYI